MAGIYGSDVFSQQPHPTDMGNKYRRNPANTRQNQIGNGPNPTGAQTVGQMQPLPGAYGQQGQLQQASGMQQTIGWQPPNTQQQLRAMTDMLARHRRSNVFGDTQAYTANGHLPRPAQPQQPKPWYVEVLNRHLEGDAADETRQQQQQQQQQAQQQQAQQPQQQQQAQQQSEYGAEMPLPTPQEQRRQRAIAPRDPTMTPHNRMALGAKNLTEGDWKTLVDQNLGASAMPADEEKFLQFVQANSQFFPTDGQYNMGQMAVSGEDLLEFIMELAPAEGNVNPQQQQQTTEQALMSKGAANLTGEDWSTLVNRTMGGGATQGDRNKFFNFVQENSEFFPTDIPDYEDLLEYILDLPAPTRQQAPLELGSNVNPQQAQQQQAQQPQQRQLSAFSQALADSNVNPQPAATPRQRQMADIREQGRIGAGFNSSAREMRIAQELGISPAQQQEQRPPSYADRAGTGRGQEFKLPPNQQLLAQKQAMEQNAAQQEAAINGSPAYQRAYNGRVKAFGSKGLTDEENAKQQQNEAELQQKYEDDLAGMRNDRANREFAMTPGGRQMDRFDKLLAQRGQQPQQGQYQSNVEQPTKNSQDALKRYYDDGDPATDRNGNSTPTLRSFTNDVGQKMLIKKSDDGRYALTGSGRRTPEDVAKIAADRQERIANASPALQKRAFDTARRRGQPRGNAVSNAMLRKQGLSPEQISNVYAGTQDKETTQLMRQPQSAVELRQDRLPGGGRSGPRTEEAGRKVAQLDAIATGAVDPATGLAAAATADQQYTVSLLGDLGFDAPSEVTAYDFAQSMRSAADTMQSLAPDDKLKAARTLHRFILNKINSSTKGKWSETGDGGWTTGWGSIGKSDSANIEAAEPIDPDDDIAVLAWFDKLQAKPKQAPVGDGGDARRRFNKSQSK
jgi:hypothetical protein